MDAGAVSAGIEQVAVGFAPGADAGGLPQGGKPVPIVRHAIFLSFLQPFEINLVVPINVPATLLVFDDFRMRFQVPVHEDREFGNVILVHHSPPDMSAMKIPRPGRLNLETPGSRPRQAHGRKHCKQAREFS
jgi:hypothetical protein